MPRARKSPYRFSTTSMAAMTAPMWWSRSWRVQGESDAGTAVPMRTASSHSTPDLQRPFPGIEAGDGGAFFSMMRP